MAPVIGGCVRARDRRYGYRLCIAGLCAILLALSPDLSIAKQDSGDSCGSGFDYGSGMVAMSLPVEIAAALAQIHRDILAAVPSLQLSAGLGSQPYRPHVSVAYGVNPNHRTPVGAALHRWQQAAGDEVIHFGQLRYWDDPAGNKTTLIVEVLEPPGRPLARLHDELVRAGPLPSQRAYRAHVTLAFLNLGSRLPPAIEAQVRSRLVKLVTVADTLIITDRCGQTYDQVGAGKPAASQPAQN